MIFNHYSLFEPAWILREMVRPETAELDGSVLFLSAFLALIFTLWRQRPLRRLPNRSSQHKRAITLRIEQVPVDKPKEDLESELRSLLEQDLTNEDYTISITQLSIVRRDEKTACATATFDTSILPNDLLGRLRQASSRLQYKFDLKFYGITPVYEAPTPEVE